MPKVSVIVPNYNHAPYLVQRFESIFNQTFQDFEVIILDDCSTDNSREVLEKFRNHPKVSQVLYNEKNSGSPFKQWNKGVSLARGEYIWIAESDDFAEPELLSVLVKYLDNDIKLGIAYSQSNTLDQKGNSSSPNYEWLNHISKYKWISNYREKGKSEISHALAFKNTIPNASAVLIRKKVYLETGGPDVNMRLCGDWVAYIKILSVSDIQFHSDPLSYHRYHAQASRETTSKNKSIYEFAKARKIARCFSKPDSEIEKRFINEALAAVKEFSRNIHTKIQFSDTPVFIKGNSFLGPLFFVKSTKIFLFNRPIVYYWRIRIFLGYWKKKLTYLTKSIKY